MWTLPELLVTRTSPSDPSRLTLPDDVPRMTSLPSGQSTSMFPDRLSIRVEPSGSRLNFAPWTSTSARGPERTTIAPLRAAIVSRVGAAASGSSIAASVSAGSDSRAVTRVTNAVPLHRV
jgi:hypothetical protein